MLLKEICTTEVVFCGRETTVLEAAQVMRQKHIGDLVVVDDPKEECTPVGLLTDRDIVVKVLAAGLNPATTTVGKVMHTPLVSASESEDTLTAIERMRSHGVRRLPVTGREGRLVGIITMDDLVRKLGQEVEALIGIISREQDRERRAAR